MSRASDRAAIERVAAAGGVASLVPAGNDAADFHVLAVWDLEVMLLAAFEAGRSAAQS